MSIIVPIVQPSLFQTSILKFLTLVLFIQLYLILGNSIVYPGFYLPGYPNDIRSGKLQWFVYHHFLDWRCHVILVFKVRKYDVSELTNNLT